MLNLIINMRNAALRAAYIILSSRFSIRISMEVFLFNDFSPEFIFVIATFRDSDLSRLRTAPIFVTKCTMQMLIYHWAYFKKWELNANNWQIQGLNSTL